MKLLETNRLTIIPEAFYAGGIYRTVQDLEVIEWETESPINFGEFTDKPANKL